LRAAAGVVSSAAAMAGNPKPKRVVQDEGDPLGRVSAGPGPPAAPHRRCRPARARRPVAGGASTPAARPRAPAPSRAAGRGTGAWSRGEPAGRSSTCARVPCRRSHACWTMSSASTSSRSTRPARRTGGRSASNAAVCTWRSDPVSGVDAHQCPASSPRSSRGGPPAVIVP
jgi:hypothetical protein